MTRECSGCGERYCPGSCFDESSPDEVALWNTILRLSEQYRAEQLTEVHSDPFRKRRAA